jgi:hypothetical protein
VAESYFDLGNEDRRQLLLSAAGQLGRDPALLEKDIWVVWLLRWLYASAWRKHLVFKGGHLTVGGISPNRRKFRQPILGRTNKSCYERP